MSTAVWTVLAVTAMVGIFGVCVAVVVVGVRILENMRARRREKPAA